MVNSRGLARLATVAVGLGIGVAVASTPGVARADDFQISIDGMDLFSTTGNTASAYSGSGDFAIAYGDGAIASAQGGTGDFALAYGSGAYAGAGGIGSDTGADDDTAIDIGTNTGLRDDGAFAGNGDLDGLGGGTGSGDTAIDIGNNTGTVDGSFAGAGGLVEGSGNGNGDTAIDVGNNTGGYGGPWAVDGNDNYAGVFGDDTGDEGAVAGTGDGNIAEVVGLNNYADAVEGNNNIAYVFDPSGTDGSEANAGYNGSSDLAAVFGDDLSSTYTQGHSDWFDILTPSGDFPGSVGPLLAELLSLF
jgi:hypothetical protein